MKKIVFILLLVLLTVALSAEEAESGPRHFDWVAFFGRIVNATILFGGLILLLRKPLIQMLTQKSIDIRSDIEQREERLAQTAVQLDRVRERLESLEKEIATMRQSSETGGAEELAKLEAAGRTEADRILALTESEIERRMETALTRLKARVADLIVERFREEFAQKGGPDLQNRMIEKNIKLSGEIHEGK
jgi:F0F1-type ATP synthase membrane subunit b/b'